MIKNLKLSLADLAGADYIDKVCRASAAFGLKSYAELKKTAETQVDCFPAEFAEKLDSLTGRIGKEFAPPFSGSSDGAGTAAFNGAFHRENAPLTGLGFYRVGEDGRLAVIGKSEHYQASCGHNFPGYELLRIAMEIGITNITHNNTRGHITRLLERELVRIANGITRGDEDSLEKVMNQTTGHVLNRVINLEYLFVITGHNRKNQSGSFL